MSIELNAKNAKNIAKNIMKSKQMNIREKFTPVNSEYTVQISPIERVHLSLTEDSFKYNLQRNSGNEWQTRMRDEVKGPLEKIEKTFYDIIGICTKLMDKSK